MPSTLRKWLRMIGPGLITGAADDDPSGIATYSQAGAKFGSGMLWTMLFTFPLMTAIQEVSARVGRVTGLGLAGNLKRAYPKSLVYGLLGLLLVANTINIGADIGAMGAALSLLLGGPVIAYAAACTLLSVVVETLVPYHKYARVLMWLTLSLMAYVLTAFSVHVPWGTVVRATLWPSIRFERESLMMVVAILGTTISPYLFFWQASQEVEEQKLSPREQPILRAPWQAGWQFHRLRIDTILGMATSNIIAWFIIVTTAYTLHVKGEQDITSAAQAAHALTPLTGPAASLLFTIGIVGTGLLAVPVLGGSAAYALGEALNFPVGLERKARDARLFYGIIAVATVLGLFLTLTPINPMKALVLTAVVNGVVAVPVMIMVMLMGGNSKLMGKFVLPGKLRALGWMATAVMAAATAAMFATLGGQ